MSKHDVTRLGRFLLVGGVSLLLAGPSARAATVGVEAFSAVRTTEGDVAVTGTSDGKVTIAFGAQSASEPSMYYVCDLVLDSGTANAAFVGNYAGVGGLSFRIKCESGRTPGGLVVVLKGATGREWYYRNTVTSPDPTVWVVNNIPLTREAGWDRNDWDEVDKDAMWAEDMLNVRSVKISICPSGTAAQSYTVDDLKLQGAESFVAGTRVLTLLEAALLDAFGVTSVDALTPEQRAQSTLVAGLRDVDVICSLYHLGYYAANVFAVEAAQAGEGIMVGWFALSGRTYSILRSTDLTQGFTHIVTVRAPTFASGIGYTTYTDASATGTGPYFYKIVMGD